MMNAIVLMAGIGSRALTVTDGNPKCLLKIHGKTILERTLNNFEKVDPKITKCFVLGYKADVIKKYISDSIVINPFFRITNSIASLWFARDYLKGDTIIMNGDVCFSVEILHKIVEQKKGNYIVIDSLKPSNDPVFNSNNITDWKGEYAGIYRLNDFGTRKLKNEIENLVLSEQYSLYHEKAFLKLINQGLPLKKIDIAGEKWTEIDTQQDFENAEKIFRNGSI